MDNDVIKVYFKFADPEKDDTYCYFQYKDLDDARELAQHIVNSLASKEHFILVEGIAPDLEAYAPNPKDKLGEDE